MEVGVRIRSMLYVPGSSTEKVPKALRSDADAVAIDLEDSVTVGQREAARSVVRATVAKPVGSVRLFVRVNGVASGETMADLDAAVGPVHTGIRLPKVSSRGEVELVDQWVAALESARGLRTGSVVIVPTLESAKGVMQAAEIAAGSSRIWCFGFGAADYSVDLGLSESEGGEETLYARSHIAAVSRAAGLHAPMDSAFLRIYDHVGFKTSAEAARRLGFQGKSVIHPGQIGQCNSTFTPTEAETDRARRIIAAFESAQAAGEGVVLIDGEAVDLPVAAMARRLLGECV